MDGIFVTKTVSVKRFSFFNGGYVHDQERVCQTLPSMIKNVSVKLFNFSNGGSIEERSVKLFSFFSSVSPMVKPFSFSNGYWWSRTCLSKSSASLMDGIFVIKNVSSNSSASLMEGLLMIKNVSVKLFNFSNGGCIGDQERVCQTLQFLQWREYWWSRTCLSNSSASLMEGSIGDQERVCQTLQLLQWRVYWWSRTCLSSSSASSMEGIFMIKNVSVKLFNFFNGGCIGDQERVCQTLQFLQWRVYWWSRTCLSNSSASLMEGVLVIKNVSVKLFSFFNGGYIRDQERVCQTLQLLQWRVYWWSRTCLSNSSVSSMEGVLVIKNVSVKLFNFFNGGIIVIKNVSVKLFNFSNGGCIGDQERVCQTLQFLQWREYWWSRTCLSNSSASSNGGCIGDQERVCQTLQLH